MKKFCDCYKNLTAQIKDGFELSPVLDFITYFRCDDVNLYNEFLKNYKEVGEYNADKLIELYCKSKNIKLNDENANRIFIDLISNIWNDNMSYHLTTSVSALNIFEYGMDPSKKESDVIEDIESLMSVLSEEGKKLFFPFVGGDINKYSFSSIPKLNVNYGRKPEWYLNLTFYKNGSLDEITKSVLKLMTNESLEAKDKMIDMISKYYTLYENSSRIMVVIPGLNKPLSNEILDSLGINSVDKLKEGINRFLIYRNSNIDDKTDKVVSSSELMFIDVKTKSLVNFNDKYKKM